MIKIKKILGALWYKKALDIVLHNDKFKWQVYTQNIHIQTAMLQYVLMNMLYNHVVA